MTIPKEALIKFVKKISATRPDEIGCNSCYEELHRFADMLKNGEDPKTIMPLMHHHLDMCSICGEEFDALLEALETIDPSTS